VLASRPRRRLERYCIRLSLAPTSAVSWAMLRLARLARLANDGLCKDLFHEPSGPSASGLEYLQFKEQIVSRHLK
jgi:hypothetical protein